ncbi:DHBP synthase RibB-like alpha/beta domain-containing protein [Naematelia encephala]|uniref:Threonylcarbamoyl-AMP synthase n=1 Tax=Naematelia encephala TaxID=71784 RepID=A0A1Y2B0E4_9TREE|nr:DHBP synthase RibB-like alpha/beta domain-containing protein [Naematelia encephala]
MSKSLSRSIKVRPVPFNRFPICYRSAKMTTSTPILPCLDLSSISITRSSPPLHPFQSPVFHIPPAIQAHLETASTHLHNGETVAFPTETVYGLGASAFDRTALQRIYAIKNRPSDNPLIIHVSSLDMLERLLPPKEEYTISQLYMALISAFWPGPLTLLFPTPNPPPPPAPQTSGIRMPSHPLALALIHTADLPLSAPSANSSGRPSPTRAQHVYNDLNGAQGLGCILDGGDCGVGVESTVVNGLDWKQGGGGIVDVLRPGGLGVEEIARIVEEVDGQAGLTQILVHGKPWHRNAQASSSKQQSPTSSINQQALPSAPGLKYRHYSPRIPVFLLLPSNIFPRPSTLATSDPTSPRDVLARLSHRLQHSGDTKPPHLGLLHYDNSPLSSHLLKGSVGDTQLKPISLGVNAETAAQRLFSSMLALESASVDAILIEGCSDDGLGLAVMERVGKAVGGGGAVGGLGDGVEASGESGRFWVEV